MDPVPFPADVELIGKLTDLDIDAGTAARLGEELSCDVLNELYPYLDFVARKSSDHIDAIHKHLQKGRKIVLTEDPNLHLVWSNGSVYIKPLPHYLLSHSFWEHYLTPGSEHRGNALGLIRSYARLVRYPSDFELAKEARLIPPPSSLSSLSYPSSSTSSVQLERNTTGDLTYTAFTTFIRYFSNIEDADVSPRWHFGQIRLSRLHWAVRILQPKAASRKGFLHRLFYEEQFWQTGQFVNKFTAPLLFIFVTLSLVLSAMQVVLTIQPDGKGGWGVFGRVSVWFSVVVIIILVATFIIFGLIVIGVLVWQLHFGYRSWRLGHANIRLANMEDGKSSRGSLANTKATRDMVCSKDM